MKLVYALLPLFAFGITNQACSAKEAGSGTGAGYDYTRPDAAKVISSKEILSFEYRFNFSTPLEWGDQGLLYWVCDFNLTREGERAHCRAWAGSNADTAFEFEFYTTPSSLERLQALIDAHDLVSLNGVDKGSHGLPADLGAWLKVVYASGEKLFAADNSGPLLADQANLAIHDFFVELAKAAGALP